MSKLRKTLSEILGKNKKNKSSLSGIGGVQRPIDKISEETFSWWEKNYILITKTRVSTLKGFLVIAFIAGAVASLVWTVSLNVQTNMEAGGTSATLSLDANSLSVIEGEEFDVDVILDTNNNSAVVARAIVNYDPSVFELMTYDTEFAFFQEASACNLASGPCEIVIEDADKGEIDITVARPTPGVNVESGVVAQLHFKTIAVGPVEKDISLSFKKEGDYADSDVILDDGQGTDFLTGVSGLKIAVGLPDCVEGTDFSYVPGTCLENNKRSLSISYISDREGTCTVKNPKLEETCKYIAPACVYTYSEFSVCGQDKKKTRQITSALPIGCEGTPEELVEDCVPDIIKPDKCDKDKFQFSEWVCGSDNKQRRNIKTKFPANCELDGTEELVKDCVYVAPTCEVKYSDWNDCQKDNKKRRTVISACTGITNEAVLLEDKCTYVDKTIESPVEVKISDVRAGDEDDNDKKIVTNKDSQKFDGTVEGLKNGKVKVYVDDKLKDELTVSADGQWDYKLKNIDDGSHDVKFEYYSSAGTKVSESKEVEVKVDTKDPEFTDLPLALSKKPGEKVWWKAKDSDKVKNFTYNFNGKKKETKKDSFIVPANTPKGIYLLKVTAYDRAGNKDTRRVVMRVK